MRPLIPALLLLSCQALAQTASISGSVVNDLTGEPITEARVSLRTTAGALASREQPLSDAEGKFTIDAVNPGQFRLTVEATGFVSGGLRSVLPVIPGQRRTNLEVRLTPYGVISGRVIDEDGEPVPGASVMALRHRYNSGVRELARAASVSTNDLGEYRLFTLAPGRYILATAPLAGLSAGLLDREAGDENYVQTYYPGVIDAQSAVAVEARAGAETQGIDFTLTKHRTFRVQGRLVGQDVALKNRVDIGLDPVDPDRVSPARTTAAGPRYAFEIRGVLPGAYDAVAMYRDAGKVYWGFQNITVTDEQPKPIVVEVRPGMQVTGEIKVEGQADYPLQRLQVVLTPMLSTAMPPSFAGANSEGHYTLENLVPTKYRYAVRILPPGFYVKSVRVGEQDALESGIDFTNGIPGPMSIVVSARGATVSGTVVVRDDTPATAATVVLVPDKLERRTDAAFYKTATTSEDGRFSIQGVGPGSYHAFAWDRIEDGAWMDPDVLRPVDTRGVKVTVTEADSQTVSLKLIPEGAQ